MFAILETAYSKPLAYIGAKKTIEAANVSEVSRSWAVERRIAYLLQHKMQILDMIDEAASIDGDDYLLADTIVRLLHKRDRINREMKGLRKWLQTDTGAITDEMIQQARDYPIDQLIDFSKGKAIAWCHDDKQPSLHHHKQANRAHCWPCGNSFDPIAVMMNRDGMTFHAAVRALCR